ncbi:hypothetical protein OG552_17170 [Streptomyces sp. NBC_01476]|uniref:hypothetical protein n=1 Tax=Streptomyces sp. NBC_01476 TaxID=2903881 RepID=UPI002E37E7EE|nr:hypothetical protein [Streptomyces sp. NBC_01476]
MTPSGPDRPTTPGPAGRDDAASPSGDTTGAADDDRETGHPLPGPGHAEVHIVAASPGVARKVAEALRLRFAAAEQRSYPAGDESGGTRLVLTVDTVHLPEASGPFQLRLVGGNNRPTAGRDVTRDGPREGAGAGTADVSRDVTPRGRRKPPPPTQTPDDSSGDGPTP